MRTGIAFAGALILWSAAGGTALAQGDCPNPDKLGIARTVEIDTTGGPGFGFEHYKVYDFLQLKEVLLTFDDGPQVHTTHAVLKALEDQCTKATFFPVGKMAAGLPEILRDVAEAGHTIGAHTWKHKQISQITSEAAWKEEIEKGFSAAQFAVGAAPIAPFFRYPALKDTKDSLAYLASRNIAIFSTDIDSFDFMRRSPGRLVKSVMQKLAKKGKGILLMHDIQPRTARALPQLLAELKAKGYRIVHMRPKHRVKTLAKYDAIVEGRMKGMAAGHSRPMSSVVRTIEETPPTAAATAQEPASN